jgi:protein-tyrosine phosphatase
LKHSDGENFDLILAMDESNHRNILHAIHSSHHHKVKLMREFDPMGRGEVPDPYYGNEKDFEEVFMMLDRSIDSLLKELNK